MDHVAIVPERGSVCGRVAAVAPSVDKGRFSPASCSVCFGLARVGRCPCIPAPSSRRAFVLSPYVRARTAYAARAAIARFLATTGRNALGVPLSGPADRGPDLTMAPDQSQLARF